MNMNSSSHHHCRSNERRLKQKIEELDAKRIELANALRKTEADRLIRLTEAEEKISEMQLKVDATNEELKRLSAESRVFYEGDLIEFERNLRITDISTQDKHIYIIEKRP